MANLIYNQFSNDYRELYTENIIQFQLESLKQNNLLQPYFHFYPSFGIKKNEKCEFLIYGQAVKGWGCDFNFNDDLNKIKNKVEESIVFSNSYLIKNNHNPLDWVNVYWSKKSYLESANDDDSKTFYEALNYQTSKSFFWNVTYKLICDFYKMKRDSWEWSKKIVWSNLYKISPPIGNPNPFEQKLQKELAIELVKKEIDELKPKFCIVITNNEWWNPFAQKIVSVTLDYQHLSEIEFFGQYNETQIIVTKRPFLGNSEKHVSQILQLIKPIH